MTISAIHFITLLIPAFLLMGIGAFIFGRSAHNLESKIYIVTASSYCIAHSMEFVRHALPIDYSPILLKYGVTVFLCLGTSTFMHLCLVLLSRALKFSIGKWHFVLYVPVLFPLLSDVIPSLRLTTSDFYVEHQWLYVKETLYITLFDALDVIQSSFTISLLVIGYVKAKKAFYKKHFQFYLVYGILFVVVLPFAIAMYNDTWLPPLITLFMGFCTTFVVLFSLLGDNVTQSTAARYKQILSLTPSAVMILDEHFSVMEANVKARQHFISKTIKSFEEMFVDEENRKIGRSIMETLRAQGQLRAAIYEFNNPLNGTKFYFEFDADAVEMAGEPYYFIIFRNVTKEQEQAQKIHDLAYKDQLTSLHNRAYFVPIVKEKLQQRQNAMLLLLDLNFFKQINDTFGHAVGDAVLQHTAKILKTFEAQGAIIARLGGDEFFVYVPMAADCEVGIVDNLRLLFETNPFHYGDTKIIVCPSFGVVYIPEDGTDFEHIYHLADERMYIDKRRIKQSISNPY